MNPRPKTFRFDVYIHILKFDCHHLRLLQAGSLSSYPDISFAGFESGVQKPGYPAVDALIGSAGVIRQDGSLSGYSVVIIVCDYIYSRQFNERAGARYAAKVSISPSKPLRPPFAEMMLKNKICTNSISSLRGCQ